MYNQLINMAPKASKSAAAVAVAVAPAAVEAAVVSPTTVKPKVAKVVAPAPAAVAEPAKKKAKTVAPIAAVVEQAAAVAVVEQTNAVTEPAAVVISEQATSTTSEFSDFMVKLELISGMLSALKTDFRGLEKKTTRDLKTATKASAKRKRKSGNRSPSGFVKPTRISSELAQFLGKEQGTEMARTEVTREINAYIRANSLQDKSNGRKINADAKLTALLNIDASKEALTYFNLQRYMSPHFFKAGAATATVTVV